MAKTHIVLRVNDREVEALVEPRMLLIHLLREQLGISRIAFSPPVTPTWVGSTTRERSSHACAPSPLS